MIDSRYCDFRFDLKSIAADKTLAARFAAGGRPLAVAGINLRPFGIVLEKNRQPVSFGAGAAVSGHPTATVAMLANLIWAHAANQFRRAA